MIENTTPTMRLLESGILPTSFLFLSVPFVYCLYCYPLAA